METHTINGKEVEIYTSIDSLPAGRYHQFNRYLLIDSHIGGNIEAVSRHVDKIALLLKKGRTEEAALTLRNMQQTMAFIIQNLDPGLLAFTPLIKSIDGVQVEALTGEQAQALVAQLTTPAAPVGFWRSLIARIKKKIDDKSSKLHK